MKWKSTEIKLEDIQSLYQQLLIMIKAANPVIETLRFVMKYKEDSVIYTYNAFEWHDLLSQNFDFDSIEKFYLYQPFNKN